MIVEYIPAPTINPNCCKKMIKAILEGWISDGYEKNYYHDDVDIGVIGRAAYKGIFLHNDEMGEFYKHSFKYCPWCGYEMRIE